MTDPRSLLIIAKNPEGGSSFISVDSSTDRSQLTPDAAQFLDLFTKMTYTGVIPPELIWLSAKYVLFSDDEITAPLPDVPWDLPSVE